MPPPIHLDLDRHSGVPVYRQLVDQVRFQVASGVLAPGDELPSTRVLGSAHGVNPMTVSKAYSELEHLGVLDRRPGLPHVVAERPEGASEADRDEALRRALAPGVAAVRQLDMTRPRALEVFDELLRGSETGTDVKESGDKAIDP